MAATVTRTERNLGPVRKITWEWTAHTDGSVAVDTAGAVTSKGYNGELVRLVTIPSAAPHAPTANYDVSVLDADGVDALMGAGQNRHESNTEQVAAANLGVIAGDRLTLKVENAGDGKKGTVHLYIR